MSNEDNEIRLVLKALELSNVGESNNNYSEEEVNEFPLWMRCCFFIQSFNKLFYPKDEKDWAKNVGFLQYDIDSCFYECAVKNALKEIERLKNFLMKEFGMLKYETKGE